MHKPPIKLQHTRLPQSEASSATLKQDECSQCPVSITDHLLDSLFRLYCQERLLTAAFQQPQIPGCALFVDCVPESIGEKSKWILWLSGGDAALGQSID